MPFDPNWLAAPTAIPMICAALSLAFGRRGYRTAMHWQRNLAAVAVAANLAISLWILSVTLGGQRIVLQMGGWAAPYGITVYADALTGIVLTLTALLAAAALPYAIGTLDQRARMNYYPLFLFLLMGVNGAFLAGDLFNLYVFFEVLLMASFVLLTLGGQAGQVNGGIRYVVLNLLASLFLLIAAGIAYGTLGTLNLAHLAQRMGDAPEAVRLLIAGLLLVVFASKAGLFPLFFWLPSSYHTPHPAVTAFFGGVLTKVGIYSLFRIFPLLFPDLLADWQPLLLTIAGSSMIIGILGAMASNTIRRVLCFLIVSQVGYMIMGLGLAMSGDAQLASYGMAAGIFYVIHSMIITTALLMAAGAAELEVSSGSLLRSRLSGLMSRRPLLAVLFFLAAFSMGGIPPSSGFVSKLSLLQAAFGNGHWLIAAVSLSVSALTLMCMARLWQKAYWGEATQPIYPTAPLLQASRRWFVLAPIAALVLLSLGIGIFGGKVFEWSNTAAQQLLDRDSYIAAVAPTDEIVTMDKEHGADESGEHD